MSKPSRPTAVRPVAPSTVASLTPVTLRERVTATQKAPTVVVGVAGVAGVVAVVGVAAMLTPRKRWFAVTAMTATRNTAPNVTAMAATPNSGSSPTRVRPSPARSTSLRVIRDNSWLKVLARHSFLGPTNFYPLFSPSVLRTHASPVYNPAPWCSPMNSGPNSSRSVSSTARKPAPSAVSARPSCSMWPARPSCSALRTPRPSPASSGPTWPPSLLPRRRANVPLSPRPPHSRRLSLVRAA